MAILRLHNFTGVISGRDIKVEEEMVVGVDCDVDDSNTMNKKVRNAQLAQYNFIFGE